MADTITFTHYFGEDNKLEINASVSPYDPGRFHGPPSDCYQPEGGEVEINTCHLVNPQGVEIPFYPDNICIRQKSYVDTGLQELVTHTLKRIDDLETDSLDDFTNLALSKAVLTIRRQQNEIARLANLGAVSLTDGIETAAFETMQELGETK